MKIVPLEQLNQSGVTTIMKSLGIHFTKITEDTLEAQMPVDHRTHQIFGILHGGASVVLAETLGSVGALLSVDETKFRCVGLDINANHIRSIATGTVTGIAKAIHIGKSTQVWEIRIVDEKDQLICISRLTVAVIPIK